MWTCAASLHDMAIGSLPDGVELQLSTLPPRLEILRATAIVPPLWEAVSITALCLKSSAAAAVQPALAAVQHLPILHTFELSNTPGVAGHCPLSPTLFGIFIDALEGWLSHRVPAAGVRVQYEGGASRLLSTLIYADDLALLANCPLQLQGLIDALAAFCSSAGLEISAAKTQVMQFLPRIRGQVHPLHLFRYGSNAATSTPLLNHFTHISISVFISAHPATPQIT